jgi:phosphate transport system permease protein
LGLGRAFGEATAVSMVAGNKLFGPTFNLFDITRTLTSTILTGLKETTVVDYDIRFSAGIVLMIVILISNLSINLIKNRIGSQS